MEAMRKKEIQIQQEKRKSNKLVKNKVIYGSIELSMRFIVALLIASLFVDKADLELSFIPSFQGITCIHALYIRPEFAPRNIATPAPSRQSHEPLIPSHSITAGGKSK